jgi:hypothetical protein
MRVPGGVGQLRAVEVELARDTGVRQPHDAVVTVAAGGEPVEEHAAGDIEVVTDEGRPARVDQRRASQVELAADVGVGEPYGAVGAVSGGGESLGEHVAVHPEVVADESGPGRVGQLRAVEVELAGDLGVR